MATKLNRRVTRETAHRDPCYGRTIMICLEEGGQLLRVWEKGRRKKYAITYADLWRFAFQAYARAALAERKAARAARRAARKGAKS